MRVLIIYDYMVNLAIFSLFVSTPLVIRSFINHPPLKQLRLWIGGYAGIVSILLVMMSVKQEGYSYDIRYVPVILVFTYLGPIPGIFTGLFSIVTRLLSGGNWTPAIVGWGLVMLVFSILHLYIRKLPTFKKSVAFFVAYVVTYLVTVFTFQILLGQPLFHVQYILFVMIGVILGSLLIESNERLRRTISEKMAIENSLVVSESKYRLIAENTSDLIMVLDHDLSTSYFSPSHELVLGYNGHELEGVRICMLVHPDDFVIFDSTIKRIMEDKESHSMEFRFKHKDGRWIEFESRCRPVKGKDGRIKHIVIISRDISERKKAEEFLLQSEKQSIVGKLAAGVAHEIRNPLTTIKGFLQIYKKEDQVIKYNDLLLSELERIETITSELLSLAKPQSVQLTNTDVKDLIEYTVEFLVPQAQLNNIKIVRQYEETAFPITCEKNQLKQMFLNILKNAMESMPGGGEIHISLMKEDEDGCIVAVKDQGCGIPEDQLHRLGQPFYSLKEKGTGLGLMISHRIIKQHQGSITYRSKVKEGTQIEIKLPLNNTA